MNFGSTLKKSMALAFIFSLSSCAEPKYVHAEDNSHGGNKVLSETDCTLQFKNSELCLTWSWENKPVGNEAGVLTFKTFRKNALDSTPIETDLETMPNVLLWMPSMGHGSSPTTVTKLDTGTYRSSQLFFIMPGEWEIHFQVKDGNSVKDEVVVSFTM